MALDQRALTPAAGFPVALTCHVATWYWAALEAASLGLTGAKGIGARAVRIASMPNGPQRAMLSMPRAGSWNLGHGLPPQGSVVVWDDLPTHSAVITGQGITGYNQGCVAADALGAGHTSLQPGDIAAGFRSCSVIAETDIVRAAGSVFNL